MDTFFSQIVVKYGKSAYAVLSKKCVNFLPFGSRVMLNLHSEAARIS